MNAEGFDSMSFATNSIKITNLNAHDLTEIAGYAGADVSGASANNKSINIVDSESSLQSKSNRIFFCNVVAVLKPVQEPCGEHENQAWGHVA